MKFDGINLSVVRYYTDIIIQIVGMLGFYILFYNTRSQKTKIHLIVIDGVKVHAVII